MKILLPDTTPLGPALPEDCEIVRIDARAEIPDEHHDAEVLVVWGSSWKQLTHAAQHLTRLRLIQSLAAGVDGIQAAGFDPSIPIATGAGLHSQTVSEHTLAMLLALLRRIPACLQAQAEGRWASELGGMQDLRPEGRLTSLMDTRVLIWGFGEIGQHLAPLLRALGAEVTGVARSAGERAGTPVITAEQLPDTLPETDVLISILPSSEETRHAVDGAVLAALPEHALVVNVGRGSTLDAQALRAALEDGTIAGAALDVTDPEPLPADDPLWNAPNLLITPHAAGGRPVGADERIAQNVRALRDGTPLLHPAR